MLRYKVADLVIALISKAPLSGGVFDSKFNKFLTDDRKYTVVLDYVFNDRLPEIKNCIDIPILGYPRWHIKHNSKIWWYSCLNPVIKKEINGLYNKSHTFGKVFIPGSYQDNTRKTKFQTLSQFDTDQLLISKMLLSNDGLLIHGNAIKISGKTFIIIGNSGDGKSTLSKIVKAQGAELLTDDRTIVRFINGIPTVFGSWLHGSEKVITNTKNMVNGLIMLKKDQSNYIVNTGDLNQKHWQLLKSVIKPIVSKKELSMWLDTVLRLTKLPLYELAFNLDIYGKQQIELIGGL